MSKHASARIYICNSSHSAISEHCVHTHTHTHARARVRVCSVTFRYIEVYTGTGS